MRQEGDIVSGMTDDVLPSYYVRWNDDNTWRFILRQQIPKKGGFKRGSSYGEVLGYIIRYQDDLIATLNE